MPENYDGSVIIKTGLDLDTIQKDAETLKKAIEAATEGAKKLAEIAKASGEAQVAMLKQANAGWSEQLKILTKIREVMGGSAIVMPTTQTPRTTPRTPAQPGPDVQVESAEYAELRKQAEALDRQIEKTIERIDKMIAIYGQANVEGMRSFQGLQYDLEKQTNQYDQIIDRMREMESDGLKFASAPTQALNEQTKTAGQLVEKYTQLATVTKRAQTEVVKTTKAITHHSALSFKNILKYALGIRSMFFLMRRIRAVAKEALKVVAAYDPAFNAVISKLLTSVKQLKADFGTMLQPLVQKGAPILNWLIDKVSVAVVELSKFFAALTGQGYIDRATVKAVDYAGSLDDVAESAEKASEALGGYDKLNVIGDQSKDSGGKAANTLGLTKDTVEYVREELDPDNWAVRLGTRLNEIFTWVSEKVKGIIDWLKQQEWFQFIVEELKNLFSDPDAFLALVGATLVIKKLATMIGATLSGWELAAVVTIAVLGFKVGNKIFESFPEAMKDELADTMGEFAEALGENGLKGLLMQWGDNCMETFDAIGNFFIDVWDTAVEWLSDAFLNIFTPLENAWKSVKEWFSKQWRDANEETKQQWAKITGTIAGTFAEIGPMFRDLWQGIKNTFASVGQWFGDKFTSAKNAIVGTFAEIGPMFRDLWQSIKNAFASVGSWFGSTFTGAWNNVKAAFASAGSFFAGVWSTIKEKFSNVKTWLRDKFKEGWDAIKGVFTGVGDWFFDNVYLKVKNAFLNLVPSLTGKFRDAWDSVKGVFVGVKTFFSGIWDDVVSTFKDVGARVGEAVGGAFKKVINIVIDTVESTLNTPIKAINKLLDVINKVPGIDIGKIGTIKFPRLAQGAVIPPNKEFLAVLGDQKHGTNIEAPLDTIVKAMEIALGGTGGRQDININIDGKTVAKVVWSETEKRYKQTGQGQFA